MTIIRNIALTLLFLFALHVSLRYVGRVLYNYPESTYYFVRAERDAYDTVLLGSSHQYCSIDTNILNKEYGMSCIDLSTSSQNFKSSYYALLQAIDMQHPDTVILEGFSACLETDEQARVEKHTLLDSMPNWYPLKWQAVRATGDPWYYYYYPVTVFHESWMDLKPSQLMLPERLEEGETFSFYTEAVTVLEELPVVPAEEKAQMTEITRCWLEEIIALCRAEGIELIMYTAPYQADEQAQKVFNGLEDFAGEHDIRYINTFHEIGAIGLEPDKDFRDMGHLNCRGQEKFTRYLAENFLSAEK